MHFLSVSHALLCTDITSAKAQNCQLKYGVSCYKNSHQLVYGLGTNYDKELHYET